MKDDLPELPAAPARGTLTFPFAVVDVGIEHAGLRMSLAARDGEARVGLDLVVQRGAEKAFDVPMLGLSLNPVKVELRSTGEPTDRFLQALGRLLEVPLREPPRARPRLALTGYSILGDPSRLASQPTRMKVVHDGGADPFASESFELLLYVELRRGRVLVGEKWTRYRSAFVHALEMVPARDGH